VSISLLICDGRTTKPIAQNAVKLITSLWNRGASGNAILRAVKSNLASSKELSLRTLLSDWTSG